MFPACTIFPNSFSIKLLWGSLIIKWHRSTVLHYVFTCTFLGILISKANCTRKMIVFLVLERKLSGHDTQRGKVLLWTYIGQFFCFVLFLSTSQILLHTLIWFLLVSVWRKTGKAWCTCNKETKSEVSRGEKNTSIRLSRDISLMRKIGSVLVLLIYESVYLALSGSR